jgi:hypothetical protein
MKPSGQRSRGTTERRILDVIYATGHLPGPALFVRGSSRRMMTMTASGLRSIREYLTDQPSTKLLDRCLVGLIGEQNGGNRS